MSKARFKFFRYVTGNPSVDRNFEGIERIVNNIGNADILDGITILSKTINTTDTIVNHGLGRPVNGWIVVDKDGLGDVYKTASTKNTITLKSSVQVTVDLYVY